MKEEEALHQDESVDSDHHHHENDTPDVRELGAPRLSPFGRLKSPPRSLAIDKDHTSHKNPGGELLSRLRRLSPLFHRPTRSAFGVIAVG